MSDIKVTRLADLGEHWVAFGIVIIVAAFLLAGDGDYAEAKAQERIYCHNVDHDVWPDYRGIYAEVCE